MKIITRSVMRWVGDELVVVEEESFEHDGPVAQAKGSESNQYYENLNKLYGMQAQQAEELMGIARETVFPAYKKLVAEAEGYGSEANQEKAATDAAADSRAATGAAMQGLEENLAGMGIDPTDSRYAGQLGKMGLQGAANEAASATGARDKREQLGFARLQDATSLGMGTPTQATAAANSASGTAGTQLNAYNQDRAASSQAIGNTVRAGVDIYGRLKDGGPVGVPRSFKKGGYVQRRAAGGILGPMRMPPPAAPPPITRGPSKADQAAGYGKTATSATGTQAIGKATEVVGNTTGNTYISAMGKGIQNPNAVQPAIDAYKAAATQQVEAALPTVAPESAAIATESAGTGATVAGTEGAAAGVLPAATAAEGAAAGTGAATAAGSTAAAGGLSAGATIGAAVPYVGAAIAAYGVGQAAGWWKDGGKVTHGSTGASGEVDGPGGPKDDLIHARLPEGSYVMPIGTVMKYGIEKLEAMNDGDEDLGTGEDGEEYADGGLVDAMVSDDEFVFSPKSAKRLGLHRLEKMRREGLQYEKQLGIGR